MKFAGDEDEARAITVALSRADTERKVGPVADYLQGGYADYQLALLLSALDETDDLNEALELAKRASKEYGT